MSDSLDYTKITRDNESFDLTLMVDQTARTEPVPARIWSHRKRDEAGLTAWLSQTLKLDHFVVETMTSDLSRPQCHVVGDGVLLVCHGINSDPDEDLEDMVSLRLWVDETRIVTVSLRPLASLSLVLSDPTIDACSPIEIAVRLIERVTHRFKGAVIKLENKLLELDDDFYNSRTSTLAVQLKEHSRQIIWFKRFAFPQSHALEDFLSGAPDKLLQKRHLGRIKQCRSITLRLAENLGALQEHALLLQDHLDNQSEERRRNHTYIFTLISGVFLPLNLFAGLLGANVGGIPLTSSSWGFAIVCLMATVVGTAFAIFIRRLL